MYLVPFTGVFGGAISGHVHDYLQFELPGILVLAVIFSTLGTGQALSEDIAKGVLDRFRSRSRRRPGACWCWRPPSPCAGSRPCRA